MNLVEEYNDMYDNLPEKIDYGGMTPERSQRLLYLEERLKDIKALCGEMESMINHLRYAMISNNSELISNGSLDMIGDSKCLVEVALKMWKQCVSLHE